MLSELESLRDPWGLYVDPTYFDQPGSIYSTALIKEALGVGPDSGAAQGLADEVCSSAERNALGEPWFSWAVTTVIGNSGRACVELSPPASTDDWGADVSTSLTMGENKEAIRPIVEQRLRGARAQDDPYTIWRQDQLEDLLEIDSTAATRPASAPEAISSPDHLSELWGYTERCQTRPALCSNGRLPSDDEVAAAGARFLDDLSLVAAIQILRVRGNDAAVAELAATVGPRRVASTGLIRQAHFVGTVDTTFTILQLAPELFPGPEPTRTSFELADRLQAIPRSDVSKRLRTLATLKAVDEESWKKWSDEVQSIHSSFSGRLVTKTSLVEATSVASAFGAMSIEAPLGHLEIFDVMDQQDTYLARLACAYSWAFDNDKEILAAYSEQRESALREARTPAEPVKMLVAGLESIPAGTSLSQEDNKVITEAARSALAGCEIDGRKVEHLYRFTISGTSSCSLDVTLGIVSAGFGG